MRIKSLMKNKKAFSAIIAALILMLIAVAAGVVVYAYVMGWIGGVQTNPPVSGIITIESYTNVQNGTDPYSLLYIRNHGTTELIIDDIYIDGTRLPEATYETLTAQTATDVTLDLSTLDLTPPDKLKAGMSIKVVCTDGTTVTQTLT